MSTGIADEAAEALESDYSDETSTFGDRVTLAREALGLDQTALAEKLGVKLKTLRNWEDNRAEPRANKLQMLAGVLNVSMIWLLSGKGRLPQVVADATQQTIEECLNELQDIQAEQRRIADRMYALERRLRLSLDG
ncbi:helix-turn-helix domain-containing protein [Amaricoccus macauensis]|uniref:helix-turn-helix domain-containing protein n=1 Tax=Amaricoccus macauensis TaxID=57001 RepID=UPI003C7D19BA